MCSSHVQKFRNTWRFTVAKRFKLITFDVYSALFDIEASLIPVLHPVLQGSVDTLAFFQTWRSKQLEYTLINNSLNDEYVTFRTITRRTLDYTLGRFDQSLQESVKEEWVDTWDHLIPWPEADDILAAIKDRGYAIGLLSNGDTAMLKALANIFSTKIDHIFSCEQTGHYKPHASIYELPLKALGLTPNQLLHLASGPTDVFGAKAAGIPCAWANRRSELVLDPKYNPDWEFPDLKGLLEIL